MKSGSILLVTGPYQFPYHEDPIDTMFRPTPEELRHEFSGLQYIQGEIVKCGRYRDLVWQKLFNKESVYKKLESAFKNLRFRSKSVKHPPSQNNGEISAVCAAFKKM